MKKILTITSLLLAAIANTNAQTTATNWTATDCSSASHTLFTELNSGKIIVMIWVMPCPSCVNGAKAVLSSVQSFATSNPGKVLAYLSDDMGDQSCGDLSTWMTSNSIGTNFTTFSNSGNTIDEANYGGSGMPHVVVMGGTDHKIYYNQKGSAATSTGITAAINTAIAATSVNSIPGQVKFSISPNPVSNKLTLTYSKAIEKVTITSLNGQVVKEEVYTNGKMNPVVNVSGIANGAYTVRITDVEGKSGIDKLIKE